ncbi:MAG TPA: response regulator [Candidatus Omnitrophota bacterium]|nr:response regulator [Candidatus Omnitrophota bacterium]
MKKILIVDDEPEILAILKFRISNWGFDPITASSGQEGIDLAFEQRPDLLLLDVMMPGMDGFEVLKKIKSNESTKGIPVIMVTVAAAKADIEKGMSLGASFYLTKPYDAQELHHRITQLLGSEEEEEEEGGGK